MNHKRNEEKGKRSIKGGKEYLQSNREFIPSSNFMIVDVVWELFCLYIKVHGGGRVNACTIKEATIGETKLHSKVEGCRFVWEGTSKFTMCMLVAGREEER